MGNDVQYDILLRMLMLYNTTDIITNGMLYNATKTLLLNTVVYNKDIITQVMMYTRTRT